MKYRLQRHAPSHPSSRARLWLGAGLLLAAALVFFARHRATAGAAAPRAGASEKRSTYVNRSFSPSATAGRSGVAETSAIKGLVYDVDGHPLRDATITAMTFETAGNIPQATGAVRSDELGRFELRLRAGTYQLSADLEGYGPASTTAHSGDSVSLILPHSGAVEGHVTDEHGNAVSRFVIDVVVAVPGDAPVPPTVFSRRFDSSDGSYRVDRLPVWEVVVRASAEGYAPAYSQDNGVNPGETKSLDFKLSRGCALTGKVEDPTGHPVANVLVDAEARFGVGGFSDSAMQTADQAESDQDGSFQLANVPLGAVVVRGYDGSHAVTSVPVDITDCARIAPVKLVMSGGGSIAGVARGGDGKPLSSARITLSQRASGFLTTTTDERGAFRFEQLPAGAARLELHHEGRSATQFADVEGGREVNRDITLVPEGTGTLRGRITTGGKPLPGVQLLVIAGHGRERGLDTYSPMTAADGTYVIDHLPKGAYLVTVTSHSAGRGAPVKPGETATVDLDLTAPLPAIRKTRAAKVPSGPADARGALP